MVCDFRREPCGAEQLAVALANSRFGHGVFVTCVSYLVIEQHKYTVNTALLSIALQKGILVT